MLCRTCLEDTIEDDLIPLFGGLFPHKIEVISSVKLVEDDNFPSMVCKQCALNINLAFNFRLVIIKSNLILHSDECSKTLTQTSENKSLSIKSESIGNDNGTVDDILNGSNNEETEQDVYSDNDKSKMRVDHYDDNAPIRQYECNQCNFKPKSYKRLVYHRYMSHFIERAVCTVCGKSVLPANMKKHMLIHCGPPATCKVCGFTSKTSNSLRSHMLYHKGPEKTCNLCGKVYTHSSLFAAHMRKHMNPAPIEKKYKCHICEKTFTHSTSLQKHIRSHTGERPYICEFCKKGFSSTNALKTHRRQHTKERPFACALCPMAFPQRVSLRTHLKSKHSSEQQ